MLTNEDTLPLLTADVNTICHVARRIASKQSDSKIIAKLHAAADKVLAAWNKLAVVFGAAPRDLDDVKKKAFELARESAGVDLAGCIIDSAAIVNEYTKPTRKLSLVSPFLAKVKTDEPIPGTATGDATAKDLGAKPSPVKGNKRPAKPKAKPS